MLTLTHSEAILFRLLRAFFGEDQVIPHMSVLSVCGGVLPLNLNAQVEANLKNEFHVPLLEWAKGSKCLFTIVNWNDEPRLVIEFEPDLREVVDILELRRREHLRLILDAAKIPYITLKEEELAEIASPGGEADFVSFLKDKFEYSEA